MTDPAQLPIYDISARNEVSNLQIVRRVLAALDLDPDEWIEHIPDRPNHDRRYVITPKKLEPSSGGNQPRVRIRIAETVAWCVDSHGWWEKIFAEKGTSSSTGANDPQSQQPTNLKGAGRTTQPAASTRRA